MKHGSPKRRRLKREKVFRQEPGVKVSRSRESDRQFISTKETVRFNASNSRQGRSNPYRQRRKSFDLAVILLNVTRMKQLIRIGVVVSSFGALALTAFAGSETYSGKEMKQVAPAPPPECNWTGFYLGLNVGGQFGHSEDKDLDGFNAVGKQWGYSESGVVGGGQVGYNYQWHSL